MKLVSTNWSYDQNSESWSCSISNLLHGTLRLNLLYWGTKSSRSLSTIQMPGARNFSESSFSLLSPSHPTFSPLTLTASPVGQNITGHTTAWMKIHFTKTSLVHPSAEYCLLALRDQHVETWGGREGGYQRSLMLIICSNTAHFDCWNQIRQKKMLKESEDNLTRKGKPY